MNTRIACLLLFVIAHASATAAPKFPLTLKAAPKLLRGGPNIFLDWSPDGKFIVSTGDEKRYDPKTEKIVSGQHLAKWDAVTWNVRNKSILTTKHELQHLRALEFSDPQDSSRLAVFIGGDIGILNLNRPNDQPRIVGSDLKKPGIKINDVFWSSDGKKVAVRSTKGPGVGGLSVIDVEIDKETAFLPFALIDTVSRVFVPRDVAWSADGKMLAISNSSEVVIYNESLKEELFRLQGGGGFNHSGFGALAWSPDGKILTVHDRYGRLLFLKTEEWGKDPVRTKAHSILRLRETGDLSVSNTKITWGPKSRRFAVGERKTEKGIRSNVVKIIHAGTGKALHVLQSKLGDMVWSPDGFKIAISQNDGTIRVFKTLK